MGETSTFERGFGMGGDGVDRRDPPGEGFIPIPRDKVRLGVLIL